MIMRKLEWIGWLLLMSTLLFAQEDSNSKYNRFGLSVGVAGMGPMVEMDRHMVDYGYDEHSSATWFGEGRSHPDKKSPALTATLSYRRNIDDRSAFEIMLHAASLGELSGYKYTNHESHYVFVNFASFGITPTYIRHLGSDFEVQGGPALYLNSWKDLSVPEVNDTRNRDFSIGAVLGLNLIVRDREKSFAKIGVRYFATVPTDVGPFVDDYKITPETLPETKIGYGHFDFFFMYGI